MAVRQLLWRLWSAATLGIAATVCASAAAHDLVAYENVSFSFVNVAVQASYGGTTGVPRVSFPSLPPIVVPGQQPVTPGVVNRQVLVLRPAVPAAGKVPALVLLTYLHGTAQDMADFAAVQRLVRDHGIWVFVPAQQDGTWNYGDTSKKVTDDAAFLAGMIDAAAAQFPVDARRVYMAGFSDGALMTETFACQFPERIAGGSVVAATVHQSDQNACKPAIGTPMVFFNGTADAEAPYGGAMQGGQQISPSAPEVAQFWARLDGCAPTPVRTAVPDTVNVDDGTSVLLDTYGNCSGAGPVLQYTVNNGGHAWPGSAEFAGILGPVTEQVDATMASWAFFSGLSR